MKVCFPHTNPIAFERLIGEYQPYMDAYESEGDECWAMPMLQTDLLTFQFNWRLLTGAFSFVVDVHVIDKDGVLSRRNLYDFVVNGGISVIDNVNFMYGYSNVQSVGSYNGYFFINRLVSSLVQQGDKYFRIVVGIDEAAQTDFTYYVSSWMKPIARPEGTKLIQYSDSRPYQYDTYFSVMPNFYSLRLPAVFMHPSPKVEKEIFQAYDMSTELVSASPYETVTLEIGGNRGLPDYIIKNLNHIFHCDYKLIDGVQYELTSDSNFEPQRVTKYNLAWLDIEMSRKETQHGLVNTQGGETIVYGRDEGMYFDNVNFQRDNNVPSLRGMIVVPDDMPWVLTGDVASLEFSQRSGIGSTEITIKAQKNLTQARVDYTLNVVDERTKSIIDTKQLYAYPVEEGIGYGEVGDTFYVYFNEKQ